MSRINESISISHPHPRIDLISRAGLLLLACGAIALIVAAFGAGSVRPGLWLALSLGVGTIGSLLYIGRLYTGQPEGVKNNETMTHTMTSGGAGGWVLGIVLTGFYCLLYWWPETLVHLVRMMDPFSNLLRGKAADQWFLYGSLYTLAIAVMGAKAILKYRHSRYQIIRTLCIIFSQSILAFLIPSLLILFNEPEFYFSYFWPLKYDYFFPSTVSWLTEHPGRLARFMVIWSISVSFIAVPVLTYFFGKRWYCSWVCGCGGLANTAGDPFRHLSSKSLASWKIERWMIHGVLAAITILTALLWANSWREGAFLGDYSYTFAKWYGFAIGSAFSGVIGVGFYPIFGTRLWCRFGCPQAAILGLLQKYFSRFRITVNGGQCISCGNCSTYCEMGIDVKSYAQRGQNVIRASCVGCGMCSTVCPRGVLKLENGPTEGRYTEARF